MSSGTTDKGEKMRPFDKILLIMLLLFPSAFLTGQSQLLSSMELFNTLYRGENDWRYLGSGKAALSVRSPRDPNVLGATELEFYPLDLYSDELYAAVPAVSVKKAYVRARFPGFKLTVGKTRLAWGQGSVFNAGDILFGSLNPVLDLSQTELRSDTAWLTAVNVPLGNFAFIETVVLPPALDPAEGGGALEEASAGGRFYFLAGGVKFEGGYLYKGETKVSVDAPGHRPYISLQGNFGPDWYLSSSLALPTEVQKKIDTVEDDWKKSWILSFGLFHMQEINRNNTLNLRLETLCLPYQNWENQETRDTVYGLYLYPELTWTTADSTFYSLQSVISPLDGSAMITGGAGWNIFQGFYLTAYLTLLTGEKSSTFAWDRGDEWDPLRDRVNGLSFMTGIRYKF